MNRLHSLPKVVLALLLLPLAWLSISSPGSHVALSAAAAKGIAKTNPSTSGPLEELDRECSVVNDSDSGGRARFCVYRWYMQPLAETDLENDYGIIWVQADVIPGRRCVTSAQLSINLVGGHEALGRVPGKSRETRRRTGMTSELISDADGNLLPIHEPGRVSQRWELQPSGLNRVRLRDFSFVKIGEWRWSGRRKGIVSLVGGIAVRWKTQWQAFWQVQDHHVLALFTSGQVQARYGKCE